MLCLDDDDDDDDDDDEGCLIVLKRERETRWLELFTVLGVKLDAFILSNQERNPWFVCFYFSCCIDICAILCRSVPMFSLKPVNLLDGGDVQEEDRFNSKKEMTPKNI